jgi:hypothetical protein
MRYAKLNKSTLPKKQKDSTNGSRSDHFMMPFIVLDKSLHKAGAGLNEFDLMNELRCTLAEIDNVIVKECFC